MTMLGVVRLADGRPIEERAGLANEADCRLLSIVGPTQLCVLFIVNKICCSEGEFGDASAHIAVLIIAQAPIDTRDIR